MAFIRAVIETPTFPRQAERFGSTDESLVLTAWIPGNLK